MRVTARSLVRDSFAYWKQDRSSPVCDRVYGPADKLFEFIVCSQPSLRFALESYLILSCHRIPHPAPSPLPMWPLHYLHVPTHQWHWLFIKNDRTDRLPLANNDVHMITHHNPCSNLFTRLLPLLNLPSSSSIYLHKKRIF